MVKLPFSLVHNALKGIDATDIETAIDEYLAEYPDDITRLYLRIEHAYVVIKERLESTIKW